MTTAATAPSDWVLVAGAWLRTGVVAAALVEVVVAATVDARLLRVGAAAGVAAGLGASGDAAGLAAAAVRARFLGRPGDEGALGSGSAAAAASATALSSRLFG